MDRFSDDLREVVLDLDYARRAAGELGVTDLFERALEHASPS
ncbi:MAG: hypothetical protein ACREHD_19120 [Pirellulales bacterium]